MKRVTATYLRPRRSTAPGHISADFIRYTDGIVNHWNKLERPGVLIENGHLRAVTLAVIDVPKEEEKGNDGHGSKIIVIPFDGAALDRDLANTDKAH